MTAKMERRNQTEGPRNEIRTALPERERKMLPSVCKKTLCDFTVI